MIETANLLNAIKNLCLGQTLKLNILIYKNELMNSFIVLELRYWIISWTRENNYTIKSQKTEKMSHMDFKDLNKTNQT